MRGRVGNRLERLDSGFPGGGRASADADVVGAIIWARVAALVEIHQDEAVGPYAANLVIGQFAVHVDSVTWAIVIPAVSQRRLLMSQAISKDS